MSDLLFTLKINAEPTLSHYIEQWICDNDIQQYSSFDAEEKDLTEYTLFFKDLKDAEECKKDILNYLDNNGLGYKEILINQLHKEDWANSWKQFFYTERVSEKIVINPVWEKYSPKDGEIVVNIDPGMSFGTGKHPTTKSCIRLIEKHFKPDSKDVFFDIGAGSGILSIVAVKLGFRKALGIELDPIATKKALYNFNINNLSGQCKCYTASLEDYQINRTYNFVVVNILAEVINRNIDKINRIVSTKPNSLLILSGTLDSQYSMISAKLKDRNFIEKDKVVDEEWTSGCFMRR